MKRGGALGPSLFDMITYGGQLDIEVSPTAFRKDVDGRERTTGEGR